MKKLKPHSKPIRLAFFFTGIIATISYRIIIIFSGYSEFWVNLCWYIGTIGFVIYFLHRYNISENRADMIEEQELSKKVDQTNLSTEDKVAMKYVFKSLEVSSERWIYITILDLLIVIYLDFIAK